jgi:hypothetical protein
MTRIEQEKHVYPVFKKVCIVYHRIKIKIEGIKQKTISSIKIWIENNLNFGMFLNNLDANEIKSHL